MSPWRYHLTRHWRRRLVVLVIAIAVFFLGRWLADMTGINHYAAGWMASAAVMLLYDFAMEW